MISGVEIASMLFAKTFVDNGVTKRDKMRAVVNVDTDTPDYAFPGTHADYVINVGMISKKAAPVLLDGKRMCTLCYEMPCLARMLFGPKDGDDSTFAKNEQVSTYIGSEFRIDPEKLLRLIQHVVDNVPLPREEVALDEIMTLATQLGGCSLLIKKFNLQIANDALKREETQMESYRRRALRPTDDTDDVYQWKTCGPMPITANMQEIGSTPILKGWQYASCEQIGETPYVMLHFRR